MRFGLSTIAVFLLMLAQASAQTAAPPAPLNRLLTAELARFSGKVGIYVKHLNTGEAASVRGDEHFDSASTIKLAIMALAFQQVDKKQLNLADRHELKSADYRPGSGILKFTDLGAKLTIRDLITQMIITSDNTATDIMVDKVGGTAKVNEFLQREGYQAVRLNMSDYEYFRRPYELIDPKYKALSPEDVFALSTDRPSLTAPRREMIRQIREEFVAHRADEQVRKLALVEEKWHGVASPSEIGRLLEGIERCTIASQDSCDEMKRMLRAQQAGTRKIPHYLSVPVGHKTGEVGGVTNDAGIIYARSGPIVMAVYTLGYTGIAGEADERIGQVARVVVEYFDGAGR